MPFHVSFLPFQLNEEYERLTRKNIKDFDSQWATLSAKVMKVPSRGKRGSQLLQYLPARESAPESDQCK